MFRKCDYDPVRDEGPVNEGLDVNIELAIEQGIVADTGVDAVYNDIEDPAKVAGRIEDQFQAMDIQKRMLNDTAAFVKSQEAGNSANPKGESD